MPPARRPAAPPAPPVTAAGTGWILPAAAILLAGIAAMAPALHGAWLWDDVAGIARNPGLRGLEGLRRIWLGAAGYDYLPVKDTLFWLEWQLWGGRVFGFHAVTLALHLASAFLLWRGLGLLGMRRGWIGGLLFAVHPVTVESVAWISETKNTLSLAFLLLALNAYLVQDQAQAGPAAERAYRASLFCFLLAMLSKTSVVMFPTVLLLYGWWRRGAVTRRDLRATAPYFAISLLLGLTALWFQEHRVIAGQDLALGGPVWRLAAAGRAIAFYLTQALWPAGLLPLYPRWPADVFHASQALSWAALGVAGGWLWSRRSPWSRAVRFGLGWFVLNLVPVLGLAPIAYLKMSWVADHLAYVPLVGLIGLAAAGIEAGITALGAGLAPLGLAGVGALALGLVAASRGHARHFSDEVTLWTYGVRGNPESGVARLNRANALALANQLAAALPEYQAAAQREPGDAVLQYDFGNALLRSGLTDEAIERYRAALHLRPGYAEAHGNLGVALQARGQMPEALVHFASAVELRPGVPDFHYNLGNALLRVKRPAEAVIQYRAVLAATPDRVQAHYNLGLAYMEEGRFADAIAEYHETIRLMPGNPAAHNNLGNALLEAGQRAEAIVEYEEALRLDPNLAGARHDLQLALRRLPAPTAPASK